MTQELEGGRMDRAAFRHFRALLHKVGRLRCRVVSDSMEPLLRIGDALEIEPIGGVNELKRFDIVVFHAEDRLVCHFFWTRNRLGTPPTITTRALKSCLKDDLAVETDCLLGRVRDRKIPFWTRAGIVLLNLLRRTA